MGALLQFQPPLCEPSRALRAQVDLSRPEQSRPFQSRIVSRDLTVARRFYAATARPLGLAIVDAEADGFALAGAGCRVLSVEAGDQCGDFDTRPETRPTHVAIEAPDAVAVRSFFRAAMEAGGRELNYPAIQRTPGQGAYYAAKVIDPDGNCIECGWRN